MLISTSENLRKYVQSLGDQHFVAVDTEFMREKTYYAKLCLIQIADADGNATLIDPLAVRDISPLTELMTNPAIVKVFHAGSQDLEIFYQLMGAPVVNHFDTQSAAALLGYRDQIGYGALVQYELGVMLSKADSFTDWAKRPLDESQLDYAADDVVYLARMYPLLVQKLKDLGRLEWLIPELREKEEPSYFEIDYPHLFWHIKKISSLSPHQLAVAREVSIWREKKAQNHNIPRKWVCADETMLEIARRAPQTQEKLKGIRGINAIALKDADNLLEVVKRGWDSPQDSWPSPRKKAKAPDNIDERVDLMMALVRVRAKDNNIATSLLASRGDLESFVIDSEQSPLLQGWRKTMIGQELSELVRGEISFSIKDDQLIISHRGV